MYLRSVSVGKSQWPQKELAQARVPTTLSPRIATDLARPCQIDTTTASGLGTNKTVSLESKKFNITHQNSLHLSAS